MAMDKQLQREPIVSVATVQGKNGETRDVYSVIGHTDPVCNRCRVPTTSHVDHESKVWCHKCWMKFDMDTKERELKESQERAAKLQEEKVRAKIAKEDAEHDERAYQALAKDLEKDDPTEES